MRMPQSLVTLADYGIIQEVVRPLMSGKEAQIYLVISGGEERVAKVYKESTERNFKHRVAYTEGRKTRNTRDRRAMSKRTRHGRAKDEAAWRSTEVEMIYRLQDAGVRVPEPHHFVDGVLVMELIKDRDGSPAPRLGDLSLSAASAIEVHQQLLADVIRMLCAGVIHGDLSEFNVLMGADGPVLIDFPQAVDPSSNQNARKLLLRDVDNLQRFLARFARGGRSRGYGQEMWSLYQANKLHADTELTGTWQRARQSADTTEVLALIQDARQEARPGRVDLDAGEDNTEETAVPPPRRVVVDFTSERKAAPRKKAASRKGARPRRRTRAKSSASASKPSSSKKTPARRTRRRPRRRSPAPGTPRSR